MKQWDVCLKVDFGDTQVQVVVPVRAPDRYDAVVAAMAVMVSGTKVMSSTEARS